MGTCVACCSAMPSMRTRQHHSAQVLAPALADVGSWLMVLDLVCPLAKLSISSIGIAIEDRDCDGWICTTCTVVLWIAYWSFDQDSAIILTDTVPRAQSAVTPADPTARLVGCGLRAAVCATASEDEVHLHARQSAPTTIHAALRSGVRTGLRRPHDTTCD